VLYHALLHMLINIFFLSHAKTHLIEYTYHFNTQHHYFMSFAGCDA